MSRLRTMAMRGANSLRAFLHVRLLPLCDAHPKRASFAVGAILPLAFAPFFILPIFYLSYGVMLRLALKSDRRPWHLFVLGWLFGFGQFFTGFLWMGEAFLVEAERFLWALPFAITLLPAGLALFMGVAFALWGAVKKRLQAPPMLALIGLVLLLALAAYARSTILTGLPWNLPGMAWGSWLYLAQPAAFIGIHGLSLLALLSVVFLFAEKPWQRWLTLAGPLVVLLFGFMRVHMGLVMSEPVDLTNTVAPVHIGVIQPNLAQRDKWLPENRDAHIDKTMRLTRLAYQYAPQIDLIIWPETAIPVLIDEGPGFADRLRATFSSKTDASKARSLPYILTGAVRRDVTANGADFYNSAMLWSGDGYLLGRSDKHHLVPFGEYLPLQSWLESIGLEQLARLRGRYSHGPAHSRLTAARLPILAPLICYEAIFPSLSGGAAAGAPRPAVLVNMTNDGWFGQWHGPYQHLAQSRLRAIEQGLPLMRAANTGISAAFDAYGQTLEKLALGEAGSFSLPLPRALAQTLYHRFGDWVFGLMLAFGFSVLAGFMYREKRRAAG